MPSFEAINYSLRPNKNIERKLIVEFLKGFYPYFNFSSYQYIGMGSLWFVDFILFHKALLITNMVSIERELDDAVRAEYSRPFGCIKIEAGESTDALPQLKLGENKSIIWLDHDSGLEGPALRDNTIVCEEAQSGSILIVTINAHVDRLNRVTNDSGEKLKKEKALRYLAGDLIPTQLPEGALTKSGFPTLLGEVLLNQLERATRLSGRTERFYPLFNIYYRDNAPMVTVGGMITNEEDAELLRQCDFPNKNPRIYGREQIKIEAPHLTIKEKLILDQFLPSAECPTAAVIEERAGLKLKAEQIKAYYQYYSYYPMFGEMLL